MCVLMTTMYRIWYHKDVHQVFMRSHCSNKVRPTTPPPSLASHFLTCPTPEIHFSYAASATAPIFPESKNIWAVVYFQWPFRGGERERTDSLTRSLMLPCLKVGRRFCREIYSRSLDRSLAPRRPRPYSPCCLPPPSSQPRLYQLKVR